MLKSGNNGSKKQTPQDATCTVPLQNKCDVNRL
jgi:hypothetical protein